MTCRESLHNIFNTCAVFYGRLKEAIFNPEIMPATQRHLDELKIAGGVAAVIEAGPLGAIAGATTILEGTLDLVHAAEAKERAVMPTRPVPSSSPAPL
ncbi:MAG: hypothetical protein ACXW30_01670 [Micavibrio sp.]